MQNKIKRTLTLLPPLGNDEGVSSGSCDSAEPFGSGTLSLYEGRISGAGTVANIAKFLTLINKVKPQTSIVQVSHEVEVELFDQNGNGTVCFKFDLANYGFETMYQRTHRFWFTNPQEDLTFEALGERGEKLEIEDIESSATRKEIRVNFPRPLESADRLKYSLKFNVKNGFTGNYYDVGTRTITNKVSFTLISPKGARFENRSVSRESAEGFIISNSPLISLSLEDDRERLSWQLRNPKPGDQFRTHWSFQ